MIRVFIVAASPLTRAGLENLLAARGVVVAGSTGAIETVAGLLSDAAPDIVLIDASGQAYEETLETLASSGLTADVGVVLLADAASAASSSEAVHAGVRDGVRDGVRAGVRAVLPGDLSPEQLVAALEAAASGLVVLHPSQANEILSANAGATPRAAAEEYAEALTRRELEVLQMLAGGLSNKEIGSRLKISEHTAKFHVAAILGKLGAGSRAEAVSIGIRRGLVLL